MITDLNFDLLNEVNKIRVDKYGVVTAFLAINKPVDVTSHDIVANVRRRLGTRQVGHAGTLDPFATGVLLVLVGGKYTKMADTLQSLDKAYKMKVLLGLQSNTLDPEGEIDSNLPGNGMDLNVGMPDEEKLIKTIKEFDGGYIQDVPLFSSVKVNGNKLRQLARGSESFQIIENEGKKTAEFKNYGGKDITIEIPTREVKLSDITLISKGMQKVAELSENLREGVDVDSLPYLEIEFSCSKGTYARQFAADFAARLGTLGMLIQLQRTRVGNIKLSDCIDIEAIKLP
jgi:tRNA pseudouridine55 synthase